MVYAQTRLVTPAHYVDEVDSRTGPSVKLQSPSRQQGESSINEHI